MKNVLIEGIGNNIMFVLLAIFLIDFSWLSGLIFAVYIVLFLIILFLIMKKSKGSASEKVVRMLIDVQAHKETDEREIIVTQKATKVAYQSTIIVLMLAVTAVVFTQMWREMGIWQILNVPIDMYVVAIIALIGSFMLIQSAFFISWCVYYKK